MVVAHDGKQWPVDKDIIMSCCILLKGRRHSMCATLKCDFSIFSYFTNGRLWSSDILARGVDSTWFFTMHHLTTNNFELGGISPKYVRLKCSIDRSQSLFYLVPQEYHTVKVAWLEQPSRKQYWSSLAKLKDYLACSTEASSSEPRMEWGGGWNDWDWLNLSCIVLGCSICWAPWSREYKNHTADGLLIRLHCNCDGMPGMPTMVPHHYRLMQVVALPPYNLAHMGRNLSCSAIIQRVPGT